MRFSGRHKRLSAIVMLSFLMCVSGASAFAADAPGHSELSNPVAIFLTSVAIALLLPIGMLAHVLIGVAQIYIERLREKEKSMVTGGKKLMIVALCMCSSMAFAQTGAAETTKEAVSATISGMQKSSFYLLTGVIVLEVIILLTMQLFLKQLLAIEKKPAIVVERAQSGPPFYITWWNKINAIRPVTEEANITLEHDYDGIRELDNKLPPWWVYGFWICIIFSVIYMYRFHVSHSAPSTIQEYELAMVQAEIEKEQYLKTAASNVDENTVAMLSDESALAEGKKIFTSSCAACHGPDGGGTVGPNLTDEYWLHNGGIKDIFRVIKYGVPEKGMKSWKDDFSAIQIAAVASYVKSLHGSKPANAKEPQGDLYKEVEAPVLDTINVATEKTLTQN